MRGTYFITMFRRTLCKDRPVEGPIITAIALNTSASASNGEKWDLPRITTITQRIRKSKEYIYSNIKPNMAPTGVCPPLEPYSAK
jgi:hypothetical protein